MKTINLENAKRLRELGVTKESDFFWELNKVNKYFKGRCVYGDPTDDNEWAIAIPAYTADEIGDMLPQSVDCLGYIMLEMDNGTWDCGYAKRGEFTLYESADTIADAMALMLIYLIENNHVKAGEL